MGVSVPEALVALLLGLFVLHLGLETLARLRSARARIAARSDVLVALRVSRHVLRSELRLGLPGRDWIPDQDSLPLRAFRGTALVCTADSANSQIDVRYSGIRSPDSSKDSVLLLGGEPVIRALIGTGPVADSCADADAGSMMSWRLDRSAPAGTVVARLFERGSYHLSGSALRYRRGASGRQPLTPEVWSTSSGWDVSGGRLGVRLVPQNTDGGRPWSGFLSWTDPE